MINIKTKLRTVQWDEIIYVRGGVCTSYYIDRLMVSTMYSVLCCELNVLLMCITNKSLWKYLFDRCLNYNILYWGCPLKILKINFFGTYFSMGSLCICVHTTAHTYAARCDKCCFCFCLNNFVLALRDILIQ